MWRKQLHSTPFQTSKTARITTLPLMPRRPRQPPPWIKFRPGQTSSVTTIRPPFNGQILTPDVHLAQAVQLAATPQSQAEQFSRGRASDSYCRYSMTPRWPSSPLPISPPMRTRASASPCRPTALSMWMWATASPCQQHLPTAARCPPGLYSIRSPRLSPARL